MPRTSPRAGQRPTPDGVTDRRIDSLLRLLAENGTIVISGARIAREIGVTRNAVWQWVQRLRGLGVKVQGHPRTGYHLEQVPDIPVPQLLARGLRGTQFSKRIFHFFKVDSTNSVALRLGDLGEPHGAVVLAEEQTAGRGRAGRAWISEKSAGIHASVLLRPPLATCQAPFLTLLAGLAAAEAIHESTGLDGDIRWPNDVLLEGKKVCGILTEMRAEPDRIHYAVVGMGMNVNQKHLPGEIASTATSLRIAAGRSFSRIELLTRLLRQLDAYYNRLLTAGTQAILERFAAASSYARGKHVRITTFTESFTGTTAGLEHNGLLRVRRQDSGETVTVLSGDVAAVE